MSASDHDQTAGSALLVFAGVDFDAAQLFDTADRPLQRELLCADDGHMSITDIAMRHGFTHSGEFSKAYRRMLGETASQSRGNSG